jgi:hypothetical protein
MSNNSTTDSQRLVQIFAAVCYGLLALNQVASAQTWTQTGAPIKNWTGIACSADGMKWVAVADGIYISTNLGTSWTLAIAPSNGWSSVASSADGKALIAGSPYRTNAYISLDSGSTWNPDGSPPNAQDFVAMSADGGNWIEVFRNPAGTHGQFWWSTNSGAAWTLVLPTNTWLCAASSADGRRLVAGAGLRTGEFPGGIYTSSDSGNTWLSNNVPDLSWRAVVSSADGNQLAAAAWPGGIITSTNSGTNWNLSNAPMTNWLAMASSADGSRLVAAVNAGGIYVSTNSGIDWNKTDAPDTNWQAVASSVDGRRLLAAYGGGIYTSYSTPAPEMKIALLSSSLALSWVIPSTNFVMQQSSDLSLWADLTNAPVFNLATLQNQIILSLSNNGGFFRLANH